MNKLSRSRSTYTHICISAKTVIFHPFLNVWKKKKLIKKQPKDYCILKLYARTENMSHILIFDMFVQSDVTICNNYAAYIILKM
jgi:hypothetical protein